MARRGTEVDAREQADRGQPGPFGADQRAELGDVGEHRVGRVPLQRVEDVGANGPAGPNSTSRPIRGAVAIRPITVQSLITAVSRPTAPIDGAIGHGVNEHPTAWASASTVAR